MEKEYFIEVKIRFDNYLSAESKEEAIEQLKDTFMQEYGIDLQNSEIVNIEESEIK